MAFVRQRLRPSSKRWRMPLAVRVLRRPVVWWLLTAIVASTVAVTIANLHEEAKRNRDRWGATTSVFVAIESIEPGTQVAQHAIERHWPQALVPPDAVSSLAETAVAIAPIAKGEAILTQRISGAAQGLSAMIPEDRRAVALSALRFPDALAVGDRVDLVATFPSGAPQQNGPVASGAIVVEIADDQVTVAVGAQEVSQVAVAIARGSLTLLVRGE